MRFLSLFGGGSCAEDHAGRQNKPHARDTSASHGTFFSNEIVSPSRRSAMLRCEESLCKSEMSRTAKPVARFPGRLYHRPHCTRGENHMHEIKIAQWALDC